MYQQNEHNLVLVLGIVDTAIHWMHVNHYAVDSVVCFVNSHVADSDLSGN